MSSSGKLRLGDAFSSLAHSAFTLLWTATLISNIGAWMHEVEAGWLMTTLDPSPAPVTLVQASTKLPVFLFALLTCMLADRSDMRRMLVVITPALPVVVFSLAVLVWQERMTPIPPTLFAQAIGTGAAFMAPAWHVIVPSLVRQENLKPAIALKSARINISRAIGAALAGILISRGGLAAPFALMRRAIL